MKTNYSLRNPLARVALVATLLIPNNYDGDFLKSDIRRTAIGVRDYVFGDNKCHHKPGSIIPYDEVTWEMLTEQDSPGGVLEIDGFMKPGWCSGYATRFSEEQFGFHFEKTAAWNLRHHHKTIPLSGNLEEVIEELQHHPRGILIGFGGGESVYSTEVSGETDEKGNPRAYTHVGVFDGVERNDDIRFVHNFANGPESNSVTEFKKIGWAPMEIILPRGYVLPKDRTSFSD